MEPAQRDPKWKAGEAQPAQGLARLADFGGPGLLAYMALDLSRKFALGGALAALSLAAGVQIPTTLRQIDQQAQSLLAIKAMKAEQRWLVGQGLASERPIGRLSGDDSDASMTARSTVGAWLVNKSVAAYANALSEATMGRAMLAPAPTINAPLDRESVGLRGRGIEGDLAFVYRHEEGHAREASERLKALPPDAWPTMVGKILAQEFAQPALSTENWRLDLTRSLRAESFADAFAVLSTARKAAGALAESALATQALRSMPSAAEPRVRTSLRASAGDHSVDMASFICGQFDQAQVAKLGAAGLDQLAEGVASASLAATLARQAPATNFFSPEGKRWWMDLSARHGADPAEAATAWTQWRAGALAERPEAAFGAFSLKAEGIEFKAKGLPDPPKSVSWRFDGHGEPLDQDKPAAGTTPASAPAPTADEGLSRIIARLSSTGAGAAWTHRAMAARMGANDANEKARLDAQVGDYVDHDAIDNAWRAPKPKP